MTRPVRYIGPKVWKRIAAGVLGVDDATIERISQLNLAESALHAPRAGFGDTDIYPTLVDKAAVLGHRLALNHPLPDGNKRTAYMTMKEFLLRNGAVWHTPDPDDAEATMLAVAAGNLDLDGFTAWVATRITLPTD